MSYGTDAGLTTYASERGITITGTASELLARAHDYIEAQQYKGTRLQADAAWPRSGVYVDGWLVDSDSVPQGIIDAEYEVALAIDAGSSPLATLESGVKRVKAGPVEKEYQDGSSQVSINRAITTKLAPYLSGAAGGSTFTVTRA